MMLSIFISIFLRQTSQKTWSAPGSERAARSSRPQHFVPSHPGAAPDSDDEEPLPSTPAQDFTPTEIVNEIENPPEQ